MSSWDCLTRRKRASSSEPHTPHSAPARQICFEPPEREQVHRFSTPVLNSSRFTLLSRIEKVFWTTQPTDQTMLRHRTPKSASVWCTTALNGAPALGVQLPSPIRAQSILLYDRSSREPAGAMTPTSSPLTKLQWHQQTPPSFTKGIKRPGAPAMLILQKPTRPEAQDVVDHKGCLTSGLIRQSQYAVVSEAAPLTCQPQISPEPTPKEELTSFSSPSNPTSSRSTNSDGTSPTSLHYRSVLHRRSAELKLPPPTPPPSIPLPPLPAPPAARLHQEVLYSDKSMVVPRHSPRFLKGIVSDHIRREPTKQPSSLRTASSPRTPPDSSTPSKPPFPYSENAKQIPPRIYHNTPPLPT
ncbi:uncharacterized protein MELLADRAFT_109283 [Melampsora larici-populina 98AG31]|uniref:Uncharacterized protein n=1 Tax=Melampsora larici-populina (strain 98AG31 / pathotype 3-4-7) TaxID=747676 RepID=F4RVZ2_MELLP|nr:uncharacterized protein MELLADRAFT_109283 [Melampsora larici-populina 98AG31]EGG03444.1 hypothetical protein MELLADRAFT_109283 [Melampsora larici-populina 98AG31]